MTNILVVDDDLTIRELLVDLLSGEGYTVTAVNSGMNALKSIYAERPDLVLMDIMMPRMDGREVLRRMRETADLREIPVILMSAAFTKDQDNSLASAFLSKPFDLRELLKCIERILRAQSGN